MEIIFLLISIIVSILFIYGIGRTLNTHKELIRYYKDDALNIIFHSFFGIMLVLMIFISLCAFNNTFWHLPYLNN